MSFAAALDCYLDARDALKDANERSAPHGERTELLKAFDAARYNLDGLVAAIGRKTTFTPVAKKAKQ